MNGPPPPLSAGLDEYLDWCKAGEFVELVVISWCVPCRKPISRGVNHVHEVHSELYRGVMRAVFSHMSANSFRLVDWEGVIR